MDDMALRRIETFCRAVDREQFPNGLLVAISGGKDSTVLADLMDRAGVEHQKIHNLTTADAPECVHFVRSMPGVKIVRPAETMWQLIRHKRMPPRRNARYCCKCQKETGGDGCLVALGIRAGESVRRRTRAMFEPCYRNGRKAYFSPIIDWSTADVWDYIHERALPYCSLYDEGWTRVGCVLCPMVSNPYEVRRQVERWPRLAAAWERAVKATFQAPDGTKTYDSPETYWRWWLYERKSSSKADPAQRGLFDSDDEDAGLNAGPRIHRAVIAGLCAKWSQLAAKGGNGKAGSLFAQAKAAPGTDYNQNMMDFSKCVPKEGAK